MKKLVVTLICMVLMSCPLIARALEISDVAGDMMNFSKSRTYSSNQFSDVDPNAWFSANVQSVYEYELMNGTGDTTFNPEGKVSIAEAIALSCRLHNIYYNNHEEFTQGTPWYDVYISYAIKQGLIQAGEFENYTQDASRLQVAKILATALATKEFSEINTIDGDMLPDIKIGSYGADAVYMFYRAGILTGNDRYGTFAPETPIERSSVAAIATRMIDLSLRKQFTLEPKPIMVTSITLNSAASTIYVPNTVSLSATVLPDNAADKSVTWTTSDSNIATVSNGVVTAATPGVATIRATAASGVYAETVITVTKRDSVRILSAYGLPNSVGGVGPTIIWRNDSGKTIKYATFTVTPYNAVGDVVESSIGKRTTAYLEVTGPIETFNNEKDVDGAYFFYNNSIPTIMVGYSDKRAYVSHWSGTTYYLQESDYQNAFNIKSSWEPVWYNHSISKIEISKVDLEYMDGSKETINNPTIWNQVWRHD